MGPFTVRTRPSLTRVPEVFPSERLDISFIAFLGCSVQNCSVKMFSDFSSRKSMRRFAITRCWSRNFDPGTASIPFGSPHTLLTENGLPTILSTSGGRAVPFGLHGVS
jgi:hypothetical protein